MLGSGVPPVPKGPSAAGGRDSGLDEPTLRSGGFFLRRLCDKGPVLHVTPSFSICQRNQRILQKGPRSDLAFSERLSCKSFTILDVGHETSRFEENQVNFASGDVCSKVFVTLESLVFLLSETWTCTGGSSGVPRATLSPSLGRGRLPRPVTSLEAETMASLHHPSAFCSLRVSLGQILHISGPHGYDTGQSTLKVRAHRHLVPASLGCKGQRRGVACSVLVPSLAPGQGGGRWALCPPLPMLCPSEAGDQQEQTRQRPSSGTAFWSVPGRSRSVGPTILCSQDMWLSGDTHLPSATSSPA